MTKLIIWRNSFFICRVFQFINQIPTTRKYKYICKNVKITTFFANWGSFVLWTFAIALKVTYTIKIYAKHTPIIKDIFFLKPSFINSAVKLYF